MASYLPCTPLPLSTPLLSGWLKTWPGPVGAGLFLLRGLESGQLWDRATRGRLGKG